ncbi:MAG TPA: DUF305 domain-containing protein [Devosia sp.]|nr:DUF305 domain-containing protein [Devosia sp.]
MKRVLFTAAAVLALGVPALAQHEHHTAPADAGGLPATCLENANAMAAVPAGHDMGGDEAHKALMAGMDKMNSDMMTGGTATDIDVAFVCSMIPHHQGAIDMARAELQYGDDAWAKEMAQKVIDAQEQEIADMLAWLEKQPAK